MEKEKEENKFDNNINKDNPIDNKENIEKSTTQKDNISLKNIKPEDSITSISSKPKKEIPIEKKPFSEFINTHLIPNIINEFTQRGFEIGEINLKKTLRPIAGDQCWVIFCEIKDICNFWLSFEKDDISSSKSISLSKPNQNPSVIESFLIDEKRITLKLIVSRILQRLNGQKLIGSN